MHAERTHSLLRQIINYYPYFDSLFSSTNFSYPEWNDKVFDLIKLLGEYPERDFYLKIQLSCDGPEYINDRGRGNGTTKKCLENLQKFLERFPSEKKKNVHVTLSVKATLSVETIELLDSKKKIIDYYTFFEDAFYKKIIEVENLQFSTALPNVAVPTPATKEIGKLFGIFCKNCLEIEKEAYKYFRFQQKIRPYVSLDCFEKNDEQFTNFTSRACLCGSGSSVIGFLPNDMVTICSEGFTHMADEYLKLLQNRDESQKTVLVNNDSNKRFMCLTDEEYQKYEKQVQLFDNPNYAIMANLSLFIKALAFSGQIKSEYQNDKKALRAARYIFKIGFCIKDNYNVSGSITTIPIGTIKLLCNGALDYLC